MNLPKISVIIPTHKRANYLDYELERIYRQKYINFEVIVINDIEAYDETDDIIKKYPSIIYIKDEAVQGPSNKHKKGYNIAKGDYLYMPDDDDYLIDDFFFYKAVSIMEKDKSIAFLSGSVILSYEDENAFILEEIKQDLKISGKIDGPFYLNEMQLKFPKPASTISTIFRKQTFDTLNAINMIEMSDTSMYILALLGGDAYILPDYVAKYRIKKNSLTTTASLSFLYNVLHQKELFLQLGKGRILKPHKFWESHFSATYMLLYGSKNCKKDKCNMLLWGLKHTHGSLLMFLFICKQFLNIILKK